VIEWLQGNILYLYLRDHCMLGWMGLQLLQELLGLFARACHYNVHPVRTVVDITIQLQLCGQCVNMRPESNALHQAFYVYVFAIRHS
jgi:hypothetical protein